MDFFHIHLVLQSGLRACWAGLTNLFLYRPSNLKIRQTFNRDSVFLITTKSPSFRVFLEGFPNKQPKKQCRCSFVFLASVFINWLKCRSTPIFSRHPAGCLDFRALDFFLKLVYNGSVLSVGEPGAPTIIVIFMRSVIFIDRVIVLYRVEHHYSPFLYPLSCLGGSE